MRAARLIHLVLLLQNRGSMRAAELAEALEVSERTVARDVLALSEAGVPVYAERGRAGGYRLVGGYRTRLTGLGRNEAEALFLSGVPGALRDMGLEDTGSAARLKVTAALLPELRDASHSAAQRFHLDAPGWYQEPETPPLLPALADAVWDDRVVSARYRRGEREVERELEPYGLVLKGGIWYLAARTRPAGQYRVYRVDRFTAVEPGSTEPGSTEPGWGAGSGAGAGSAESGSPGGRFERDPGFDLPGFWARRAAEFARAILRDEVVVRLTEAGARRLPAVVDRAAAQAALDAAGPPDGRTGVTVTLPVESLDVAFTQLLALGPEAEVLAPDGLRERFAEAARTMAARYAEREPPDDGDTPDDGDPQGP